MFIFGILVHYNVMELDGAFKCPKDCKNQDLVVSSFMREVLSHCITAQTEEVVY